MSEPVLPIQHGPSPIPPEPGAIVSNGDGVRWEMRNRLASGSDNVVRPLQEERRGKCILSLFGTRPEAIKLAPVLRHLETLGRAFRTVNVNSGQHADLLRPFLELFAVRIDYDLCIMKAGQSLNVACARILASLDDVLAKEKPDLILVQGDTTTALAGALAGFHHGVPVAHVEAGLRSGNPLSPFPEEMNRRLISRLARFHFAATPGNRAALLDDGVDPATVFVTGNTVVDSLLTILERPLSSIVRDVLDRTSGLKRIVLTTHRRESFGGAMEGNLIVLRQFIERHPDVALLFPVHPNPKVRQLAAVQLGAHPRIHLLDPQPYHEFIGLLQHAWLIVSDSGGIQEEAPTLGKPLLILRENTERPEAVACGVARLVGGDPNRLHQLLEELYIDESWMAAVGQVQNPFGCGDSGKRIVEILGRALGAVVA
jgi:UDP-N-acetylglucosamine 2-epimerase (non-hydrolysing)